MDEGPVRRGKACGFGCTTPDLEAAVEPPSDGRSRPAWLTGPDCRGAPEGLLVNLFAGIPLAILTTVERMCDGSWTIILHARHSCQMHSREVHA
jgi:hypothetical protein